MARFICAARSCQCDLVSLGWRESKHFRHGEDRLRHVSKPLSKFVLHAAGSSIIVISLILVVAVHRSNADQKLPASVADVESIAPSNKGQPWAADDPALKSGDLTIWKLQAMAQSKQFEKLNWLFDHGLNMNRLPTGYAAGRGARVLGTGGAVEKALVAFTGANWYGKIFYNSKDPASSHGLNRIRATLGDADSQIRPMGAFKTRLLNPGDLKDFAPKVASNFVTLNYAHPASGLNPNLQEKLLKVIPVYDVMVAVPGKYGPLYVGKTWLGRYGKDDEFHALNKDKLIAWYFLDFNPGALSEQIDREELKLNTNSEM